MKKLFVIFIAVLLIGGGFFLTKNIEFFEGINKKNTNNDQLGKNIQPIINTGVVNSKVPTEVPREDKIEKMRSLDANFSEAMRISEDKNYTGAIEYLRKAKASNTSTGEVAIIDFNIALNTFNVDRDSGIKFYIDLSKNVTYPKRTRVLALQRAYLMYRKYNDISILKNMAGELNIPWTTEEEVKTLYMQRSYDLYPMAVSMVFLMSKELKNINTKAEALTIYTKYKKPIEISIEEMKVSPGELTEATSSMLRMSQIMGELYRDYAIGTREDVENSYKKLIQFGQEKLLKVNMQYTLLYYANFLADIGDNQSTMQTLKILLEDGLERPLIEALPGVKDLTGLKSMTGIVDKSIQELIDYIGTK